MNDNFWNSLLTKEKPKVDVIDHSKSAPIPKCETPGGVIKYSGDMYSSERNRVYQAAEQTDKGTKFAVIPKKLAHKTGWHSKLVACNKCSTPIVVRRGTDLLMNHAGYVPLCANCATDQLGRNGQWGKRDDANKYIRWYHKDELLE